MNLSFWRGKRVFLTGHTGFKGSWLSQILIDAGATLTGYALEPPSDRDLFYLSDLEANMNSHIGDIRNREQFMDVFESAEPEIVIHMAAQPIVRESYKNPTYTYETNVMGTVNLLECIRLAAHPVKSVLNVTTDKVYHNKEWSWGYRETDQLGGYDPYSNSKSCSELITNSYKSSFLTNQGVVVSTARAGNVIGGGDFAEARIVPDCVRAAMIGEPIIVRNPHSTRPYQHVLEPLFAYLLIAQKQYENGSFAGSYNVGPEDKDCVTTGHLVDLFCETWGNGLTWVNQSDGGPHEANFLKLDCSLVKATFGWQPKLNVQQAVALTVDWTKAYLDHKNVKNVMIQQINDYTRL